MQMYHTVVHPLRPSIIPGVGTAVGFAAVQKEGLKILKNWPKWKALGSL